MKKVIYTILAVLALPAFLLMYSPSMELGGFGLVLGFIGTFISPLIILFALGYMLKRVWSENQTGPTL